MIRDKKMQSLDDANALDAIYSNCILVINDYSRMLRPGNYGFRKHLYIPTLTFIKVHTNRPLIYRSDENRGDSLEPTDERFKDDPAYKDAVSFFLVPGEAKQIAKRSTKIDHFPRAFLRENGEREFASLVTVNEPIKDISFKPSIESTVAEISAEKIAQDLRQFLEFPREVRVAEPADNNTSLWGRFDFYGGGNPEAYGGQYQDIFSVYQKKVDFLEERFGVRILRNRHRFLAGP